MFCRALIVLWFCAAGSTAVGQDAATESNDQTAAIQAAIQSYVDAFNAKNAEKLVSHWSEDGVYTSRSTGEQVVGREAMAKEFATMLAGESVPKLAVVTDSIEFISPNVALERGTATVTSGDNEPVESTYRVVYVKRDGQWLIDRVTEDEIVIEASHRDELQDLQWLVGQWNHQSDSFAVDIDCQWTTKQNFISRKYTVTNDDGVESSGLQIIGWDPNQKQVRSWLFDSDGGFVKGVWNKKDDRWVVQNVATLTDGGSGSYTSIFRPMDDGTYTWQKINRVVEGEILPNIDEIVFQNR